MAILKRVTGSPAGQIIELKGDQIVIGRAPECQIILDPNGVSRRHAEVRRVGDGHALVDLNSRNRTKLNDTMIAPRKEYPLRPGDRIHICDVELTYHLTPPGETIKARETEDVMVVIEGGPDNSLNMQTLDASRSSTLVSVVRPEVKLTAILEITRNLSSELRIDAVAPKILDSLAELFPQAERLFLVLQDPASKRLIRKAFKYRPNRRAPFHATAAVPEDEIPVSISRSIVSHVLGQKKAVLSQDASIDQNLPASASIADLKIRSVMCVPLLTPDGQALGILQLDTSDRRQFHQDDLDVLAAVASQAAIAIQNARMHESLLERERLEHDLKLAEQVQKRFLPRAVPMVAGWEFFAHYNPAYEVGGDYYDFVPLPNQRLALALGDVSGKGVAAALMMAKFSGDTRFCLLSQSSPGAAAAELNRLLYAAGIEEKFITLSLGVIDLARRCLTLASAGHLPLLVRRADGRVEEIGEEITGFPLGILPESSYRQLEVTLQPGDIAMMYSDGITDPRNTREELYDSRENRRLLKRLTESPGGPEAVGRSILQDIREFSTGHFQTDDITLVCFGPVAG
ncbi:MAG: SpoIIE family protein phosphatase [Singulisphaera sp.]|nr:SpoIIE family protein phosphatase [Singulisphaera sp.]